MHKLCSEYIREEGGLPSEFGEINCFIINYNYYRLHFLSNCHLLQQVFALHQQYSCITSTLSQTFTCLFLFLFFFYYRHVAYVNKYIYLDDITFMDLQR